MNESSERCIVKTALRRSFALSHSEAEKWLSESPQSGKICVLLAHDSTCLKRLEQIHRYGGKAIIFGAPVEEKALNLLGIAHNHLLPSLKGMDSCSSCINKHHTESPAFLLHGNHPLQDELAQPLRRRPFTRFDFTNEWNNMGFGRIRTDSSPWAVQGGIIPTQAKELSRIYIEHAAEHKSALYAGAYLTLLDTQNVSILWCARPLGPIDSTEWSIVERFVCDWRADELPSAPLLRQVPEGCQALVTMRLDCDEDISSADDLFSMYQKMDIPFSLAVKTKLSIGDPDLELLRDVFQSRGTLLSHSHSHLPDWGETESRALHEAKSSREWFEKNLPDCPQPVWAVSPFHSNPPYALKALSKAGFKGFVSGIIHNDPEYLLGRAGLAPLQDDQLISISQQSMLHGDCYRQQGESVATHIDAFSAQYKAKGIFGYLDHPFSSRYQYGWESKGQRREAHIQLITAIQSFKNVWFWSQGDCLKWVLSLSKIQCETKDSGEIKIVNPPKALQYSPVLRWQGKEKAV